MAIDPTIEMALDEEAGYVTRDALDETAPPVQKVENDKLLLASRVSPLVKVLKPPRSKTMFEQIASAPKKKEKPLYNPEDSPEVMETLSKYLDEAPPSMTKGREVIEAMERDIPDAVAHLKKLEQMDQSEVLTSLGDANTINQYLDVAGQLQNIEYKKHGWTQAEADAKKLEDMKFLEPMLRGHLGKSPLTDTQYLSAAQIAKTIQQDLQDYLRRIEQGDRSPQTLVEMEKLNNTYMALAGALARDNTRVAQRMAIIRKEAQALDSGSAVLLSQAIKENYNSPQRIMEQVRIMQEKIKEKGVTEGLMEANHPSLWTSAVMWGNEIWKSSILSGPKTHIVNITSTGLMALYEQLVVKNVAMGIGFGRQALEFAQAKMTGRPMQNIERVTMAESMGSSISGMTGVLDGMSAFVEAFRQHDIQWGGGKTEAGGGYAPDLLAGVTAKMGGTSEVAQKRARMAGKAAEYMLSDLPFRLLEAQDAFYKTAVFRSEITGLSIRDAYANGKTGMAAAEHAQDIIDNIQNYPDIYQAAERAAAERTFTSTGYGGIVGIMSDAAKRMVKDHPMLNFILPFINTPANIVNYTIDSTPIGWLGAKTIQRRSQLAQDMAAGGARRDLAYARIIAGTSVMGVSYLAYDKGLLTGRGPENPNMRKVMEKAGWQPNSIVLDGKLYQYNRMEPVGKMIGMVADYMDEMKYSGEKEGFESAAIDLALSLGSQMIDSTYLKGVKDLMDALTYGGNAGSRFLANYGAALIPYSSLRKTVADIADPQRRVIDKLFQPGPWDQTKHLYKWQVHSAWFGMDGEPLRTQSLRPARHWDGSVITPKTGSAVYALSPIRYNEYDQADEATKQLIMNQVPVSEPKHTLTVKGVTFSLLDFDGNLGLVYDNFVEHIGKARKEAVDDLIGSAKYQRKPGGPDSPRHDMLRSKIHAATVKAQKNWMKFILPDLLESDPRIDSILESMFNEMDMSPRDFFRELGRGMDINNEDLMQRFKVHGTRGGAVGEEEAMPTGQEYLPAGMKP